MKKLILLSGAVLFTIGSFAQSIVPAYRLTPKLSPKMNVQNKIDDVSSIYNFANSGINDLPTGSNDRSTVSKMKFSSSYNLFTLITSTQQCLTGDFDLNLISFTHRQCGSYPGNSGLVQTSFSVDGGNTWDTSLIIQTDTTQYGRYPSGGIYNPAGNTDPNNAFAVISGPITSGSTASGGWIGNYFCSSQLDGTNNDQQFELNANGGTFFQHMARYGFTTTAQAKAYVLGSDWDFNEALTTTPFNGLVLNTGSFNSGTNKFDWNRQKFYIAFSHDPADNTQNWGNFGSIAFNAAGDIGYMVILGRDSVVDNNYNQPLIFKTIDAGANWVYQTPYDFSTVTSLTQYLKPTTDGSVTGPFFTSKNGFDLLVDSDDNLHVICQVNSAYSSDPDSLGYIWNDSLFNQMFDVYQTSTGWAAFLIDTIQTEPVYGGISPWSYGGGITWDGRMQASMNESRTKFFYTWLDTDFNIDQNNTFPNIFSCGYDIANQKQAGPWNFTGGNQYNGDNYWLYASDKVITNGSNYQIPVTTSKSKNASDDGTGLAEHYFVQGIGFSDADFYPLSAPSIKEASTFNVSQNIPNPANDVTSFTINLTKASDVKVEVTNLLGQTLISLPVQNLKSGINNINLNIKNLSSGVYFYTVKVGNEKSAHKMIVE